MEIGFLLAIMSLIPTVEFDPEDEGLVPSVLTDEELSLLGQAANITVGLVPGLATVSFLLFIAQLPFVALLFLKCISLTVVILTFIAWLLLYLNPYSSAIIICI